MPQIKDSDLQFLTERKKQDLDFLRNGARLERVYGITIQDLTVLTCKHRFQLARAHLRRANTLLRVKPVQNRAAIAGAYYAMYHAARTVVFFSSGGDDNQSHADLPKSLPKDFPNRSFWENELKTARLERNRADYDPYPKKEAAFSKPATDTTKKARLLLITAKKYLNGKGCNV